MQRPFSEPAALAFYLGGLSFYCLWLSVCGYQIMRPNLLLLLSIVAMLLSTSTTGIVTLAVGLPMVLMVASVDGEPRAMGRVGKTVGILLLGGLIVIGPIFILKPELLDAVSTVVESTFSKGESESYSERTGLDAAALDTVGASYGLGVGWGSFRSSSLIPGLLANSRIFGTVMALWFVLSVVRLGGRARIAAPGHPGQILVDGFTAALCGQFQRGAGVGADDHVARLLPSARLRCRRACPHDRRAAPGLAAVSIESRHRTASPDRTG